MVEGRIRPSWAEVDLDALRHNVTLLSQRVVPAALWAVVKADAYGHGAVPVARTALRAGVVGLGVALVDEGIELREHGISAPVLVLSEVPPDASDALVRAGLSATVSTHQGVAALAAAGRRAGTRVAVHVKVDTGMHRVGVTPGDASALVSAAAVEPALRVEAVWTHLAVADGTSAQDRAFTALQLQAFDHVVAGLPERPHLLHAANTAGAVAWPRARYDMVRCGIGMYGLAPSRAMTASGHERRGEESASGPGARAGDADRERDGAADPDEVAAFLSQLRPVLSLKARVAEVRELGAGERPSYGRQRPLPERSVVATVPIGYADGVRRGLFEAGCPVLVAGRRCPLAGVVTMDQIMVDCGPEARVAPGDEVVLIGRQGSDEITAASWAACLGTIGYEVLCGIAARVPRVYVGADARTVEVPEREGP